MSFRLKEAVFKVRCREPGCPFFSEIVVKENIMAATEQEVDAEAQKVARDLGFTKHDALFGRMHPMSNPEVSKVSGSYEHLGEPARTPAAPAQPSTPPWQTTGPAAPVRPPIPPAVTTPRPVTPAAPRPAAPAVKPPAAAPKKVAKAAKKPARKAAKKATRKAARKVARKTARKPARKSAAKRKPARRAAKKRPAKKRRR